MAISPQMSSISATDLSLKPSTFWTFTSPRVIDSLFHTPFRATAGCKLTLWKIDKRSPCEFMYGHSLGPFRLVAKNAKVGQVIGGDVPSRTVPLAEKSAQSGSATAPSRLPSPVPRGSDTCY